MNNFNKALEYFAFISVELFILFMGISAAVALLLMYIPQERLKSWISRRGIFGNILGSIVGALTPFCACSTIPMTLGMLNAGSPFGPVMSFVIASPILNPIILTMVATLLGVKAAVLYAGITFTASVLFGLILDKTGFGQHVRNVRINNCCVEKKETVPATFGGKLKTAFSVAWGDFKKVSIFLFLGVGAGAIIYGYIPQEAIVQLAGPDNPLAIPVAALVGIPLYIRAETAIPIGMALAEKGMSLGAVMALIIGGAGMAIPEMTMLASIFKKRLVAAVVVVIFSTAVLAGLTFNTIV